MVELSAILNALALFIPAMIGVGGSYGLYRQRQRDAKQNLRAAFLAELQGTGFLDVWPETSVPAYNFLSVSVYESNTGSFGLLTNDEVTALVRYYSRAKSLQDSLRIHSEIIAQTEGTLNPDTDRRKRETGLRSGIDKLELARQRAILTIKHAQGNAQFPEAGMRLSNIPEGVREDQSLLLDYGLADGDPKGETVLTDRGNDFFHGEQNLTGMEQERDVLDRKKHPVRQRIEFLWNWVQDLLKL